MKKNYAKPEILLFRELADVISTSTWTDGNDKGADYPW